MKVRVLPVEFFIHFSHVCMHWRINSIVNAANLNIDGELRGPTSDSIIDWCLTSCSSKTFNTNVKFALTSMSANIEKKTEQENHSLS